MWFVADFLLAFVVIAAVLGFHVGPHSHAVAGIAGVVAAIWLLTMAATGFAAPLLWVALGADVALTAGVGAVAWRGLQTRNIPALPLPHDRLIGATGVAAFLSRRPRPPPRPRRRRRRRRWTWISRSRSHRFLGRPGAPTGSTQNRRKAETGRVCRC